MSTVKKSKYTTSVYDHKYGKSKAVPKNIKKYVNKRLHETIELKHRIYQYNAIGYNVTGGAVEDFSSISYGSGCCIAGLASGIANNTGDGQRIGDTLTIKGVQIRLAFQPGDNQNYIRLLLVSPIKQCDRTSRSAFLQQLMSNQASSATQWAGSVDTTNYKVYMDKQFYIHYMPSDGANATQIPMNHFVKKFFKINKKITWDVANGTVPQRELYLVAISDSTIAANPGAVAGFVKLWYTDA